MRSDSASPLLCARSEARLIHSTPSPSRNRAKGTIAKATRTADSSPTNNISAIEYLNRRYRRAEAYTALDGLLSTAMQRQERVEKQLADFLATSPKLAKHLARWQAQGAKI